MHSMLLTLSDLGIFPEECVFHDLLQLCHGLTAAGRPASKEVHMTHPEETRRDAGGDGTGLIDYLGGVYDRQGIRRIV